MSSTKNNFNNFDVKTNFSPIDESIEQLYLDSLKVFIMLKSQKHNSANQALSEKFITPKDLTDVNCLNVKVFLDQIRSDCTDDVVKNFLEVLFYPISKGVRVDAALLGNLIDPRFDNRDSQQLLENLKSSKEVLLAFRKFIVAIEDCYFKEIGIVTNLDYRQFRSLFLSGNTDDVSGRFKVLAYFLVCVLEHVLMNNLNKNKQNKVKQVIKHINKSYNDARN